MFDTKQKVSLHLIRAGDEADGALSEIGRAQAAALNAYLLRNPMYIHAAWSSTRLWARETMELLYPGLRIPPGTPVPTDERLDRAAPAGPAGTPPRDGPLGAKDAVEVGSRVRRWLFDTVERSPTPGVEKTIVAVTHATAIRPLLQVLLDLPPALADHFHVDHASVTSLRWLPRQGIWEVRRLNATSHLPHTSW